MILRWTDRAYGQHYLPIEGEVTLLGVYGHEESRPNYGRLHDRSTAVWADPPADDAIPSTDTVAKDADGRLRYASKRPDTPAVRGDLRGEYGDNESGDGELKATGDRPSVIAVLLVPGYGGPEDGLLQISCVFLCITNDQGDTIDVLVQDRR